MIQGSLLRLWIDENATQQSNKKITDDDELTITP